MAARTVCWRWLCWLVGAHVVVSKVASVVCWCLNGKSSWIVVVVCFHSELWTEGEDREETSCLNFLGVVNPPRYLHKNTGFQP